MQPFASAETTCSAFSSPFLPTPRHSGHALLEENTALRQQQHTLEERYERMSNRYDAVNVDELKDRVRVTRAKSSGYLPSAYFSFTTPPTPTHTHIHALAVPQQVQHLSHKCDAQENLLRQYDTELKEV
jgi:hypothetical protein